MNTTTISIAETLFEKKIPFCLYRFPNTDKYLIAMDDSFLPHHKGRSFWVAPFVKKSAAKDLFLSVLSSDFFTESYLKELKSLPTQNIKYDLSLPKATTEDEYFERINSFLNDIHAGKLDKAILSRVFYEERPQEFNLFQGFERMCKTYPETFVHLLVHPDAGIWMGATPELLMEKRERQISIMALAGTQARKANSDYSWREKEMEEHLMVGRHIEKMFGKYQCEMIKRDGPHTIERGRVAHLSTDYEFEAKQEFNIRTFLDELHPTPAVGGLPVDKGVDCILEHEGYDRKYYCGFIGETDFAGQADLYINLRNMQIGADKIAIFVGGGITGASDPQEEWQETIMKSKTMVEMIHKS